MVNSDTSAPLRLDRAALPTTVKYVADKNISIMYLLVYQVSPIRSILSFLARSQRSLHICPAPRRCAGELRVTVFYCPGEWRGL